MANEYKAWNKARDCAKVVIDDAKNASGANRLYNLAYWGKAMRGHMDYIKTEGLGANVKPEVSKLVARAEAVLAAECDGKDCSFVGGQKQ